MDMCVNVCGVLFIEFSDSPPWSTERYGMGGMGLEVLDAGLVMGFFCEWWCGFVAPELGREVAYFLVVYFLVSVGICSL